MNQLTAIIQMLHDLHCFFFPTSINGVPACSNELLMMDILRGEWNFTGYVVSDEGAIENQISFHHYYNNSEDAATGSVNAGCNLELSGNLTEPVFMKIGNSITQTYWFHYYSLGINLKVDFIAEENWYFKYTHCGFVNVRWHLFL